MDNYEPPPPVYITRFTASKPTQTTGQNPVPTRNPNLFTGSTDCNHHPPSRGRTTSPNTHRGRRRLDHGPVHHRRGKGTETPEGKRANTRGGRNPHRGRASAFPSPIIGGVEPNMLAHKQFSSIRSSFEEYQMDDGEGCSGSIGYGAWRRGEAVG